MLTFILKIFHSRVAFANLSDFFSKHGSNGKNMSNLSSPPKSLESSDSSRSLNIKVSDTVNRRAAFDCWRNSETTDGRHTCLQEKTEALGPRMRLKLRHIHPTRAAIQKEIMKQLKRCTMSLEERNHLENSNLRW